MVANVKEMHLCCICSYCILIFCYVDSNHIFVGLSDTGSNKSASPQQDLGLISLPTHLPSQTPTSKSIASKISPLTREQLQQAIIHLLNVSSIIILYLVTIFNI